MQPSLTSDQLNATVRADAIPTRMDLSAGQRLHLPEEVLHDVEAFAESLDRSVGWCLWMAWCTAVVEAGDAASLAHEEVPEGERLATEVVMPLGTWRHVTEEAERLDRSKSWLLCRAWLAARDRMHGVHGR
ncbi:MAG: hypothetical protein KC731_35875 [Myxococcales bacterium]|nr:hypothetical protein [Myxococcales bacterium]